MCERLLGSQEVGTAGDLKRTLGKDSGVDPEDLAVLGDELGYAVDFSWLNGEAGRYDVVFTAKEHRANEPLTRRLGGRLLGRAQQGRLENVEVSHWRERVGEPAQFLGCPAPLMVGQPLGKPRQDRAQTPHGDAHLVDAARHTGERCRFVARQMLETG